MKLLLRALAVMVLGLSLFLVPAFATELPTLNEDYTIWATITQDNILFNAQNATITLINPSGSTVITDAQMTEYSTGIFTYDFNFTIIGEWFGIVNFYNTTSLIATTSNSIIVREIQDNMIPDNFLIIILITMLGFFAFYIKNYALLLSTGILFMVAPFIYNFGWDALGGTFQYLAFMLIGLALMFQAISLFLDERKRGKR